MSITPTALFPFEAAGAAAYREGMSRVASAVHIVTTGGQKGRAGFTATAVVSVSDDPATLMVCLNSRSQLGALFRGNGVFCVNTLSAAQQPLADVFAGRTGHHLEDRFAFGEWMEGAAGAPVLRGALAAFECHLADIRRLATHDVMAGAVTAVHLSEGPRALTYFKRAYHHL